MLEKQGDTQGAIACYRRAVELKPGYVDANCNLEMLLLQQRKVDEAALCYERAVARVPRGSRRSMAWESR